MLLKVGYSTVPSSAVNELEMRVVALLLKHARQEDRIDLCRMVKYDNSAYDSNTEKHKDDADQMTFRANKTPVRGRNGH
jgi:hypothetical protein